MTLRFTDHTQGTLRHQAPARLPARPQLGRMDRRGAVAVRFVRQLRAPALTNFGNVAFSNLSRHLGWPHRPGLRLRLVRSGDLPTGRLGIRPSSLRPRRGPRPPPHRARCRPPATRSRWPSRRRPARRVRRVAPSRASAAAAEAPASRPSPARLRRRANRGRAQVPVERGVRRRTVASSAGVTTVTAQRRRRFIRASSGRLRASRAFGFGCAALSALTLAACGGSSESAGPPAGPHPAAGASSLARTRVSHGAGPGDPAPRVGPGFLGLSFEVADLGLLVARHRPRQPGRPAALPRARRAAPRRHERRHAGKPGHRPPRRAPRGRPRR